MTYILLLFLPHLSVSATDRADWPTSWAAKEQYEMCGDSITNLRKLRAARGYEDGRWDEWIQQTEDNREAWGRISAMESNLSDVGMCDRLLAYKRLIGPYRYLKRWRPPVAPYPYPDPASVMPAADMAGK